eukprot:CAMPEP_0176301526 /NCGR_PEP_ID=MMETSP0121_2-20121125/60898_1 /TAXON_ID=160619 /ORGANISM="Kryptoperidinium foliaceum, Strain CCMP 1326" /LENGTH=186 /DNA_ID=CAMNT_0017642979 /DNA_START=70 /DNA_END=626 /DNA_ORIENTATION=-
MDAATRGGRPEAAHHAAPLAAGRQCAGLPQNRSAELADRLHGSPPPGAARRGVAETLGPQRALGGVGVAEAAHGPEARLVAERRLHLRLQPHGPPLRADEEGAQQRQGVGGEVLGEEGRAEGARREAAEGPHPLGEADIRRPWAAALRPRNRLGVRPKVEVSAPPRREVLLKPPLRHRGRVALARR